MGAIKSFAKIFATRVHIDTGGKFTIASKNQSDLLPNTVQTKYEKIENIINPYFGLAKNTFHATFPLMSNMELKKISSVCWVEKRKKTRIKKDIV
jgi:hypothetical protein